MVFDVQTVWLYSYGLVVGDRGRARMLSRVVVDRRMVLYRLDDWTMCLWAYDGLLVHREHAESYR